VRNEGQSVDVDPRVKSVRTLVWRPTSGTAAHASFGPMDRAEVDDVIARIHEVDSATRQALLAAPDPGS
jgi:hypothetical protein